MKLVFSEKSSEKCCCFASLSIFIPLRSYASSYPDNAELLLKFLKSSEGLRQIKQNARGTVRQALRFEDLRKIEISIPDYSEQKIIFQKLNETDQEANGLTSELTHQLDLVKQLRQSFLREAMQGKLVPQDARDEPASELLQKIKAALRQAQDDKKGKKQKELPPVKEIPFEIPENWVWCRLGGIGLITGGGTPSMARTEYWNGNIPWISPKDMISDFVSDSEMKITSSGINNSSAKIMPKGSLIIVGRSGILKRKLPVAIAAVECAVNQDMKVIIPHLREMNRFLQLMFFGLENIILRNYVKFGMTVHSLKYKEFAEMPIPLPPLPEQHRIVAKLEQLMQLCDDLEQSIRQSKEQTNMLLQAALREALQTNSFSHAPEEIAVVEGKK